jgi:hypothetical protein
MWDRSRGGVETCMVPSGSASAGCIRGGPAEGRNFRADTRRPGSVIGDFKIDEEHNTGFFLMTNPQGA